MFIIMEVTMWIKTFDRQLVNLDLVSRIYFEEGWGTMAAVDGKKVRLSDDDVIDYLVKRLEVQ